MKKLLLLLFVTCCNFAAFSQNSYITDKAPGSALTYKAEFSVAHSASDADNTEYIDEVCYRICFDGDKAYIYNLFSITDTQKKYFIAEVRDKEIHIPTGYIYNQNDYAYSTATRYIKKDGAWVADTDNGDVVWTIGDDGTIRELDPDVQLGSVVTYKGYDDMSYEAGLIDRIVLVPVTLESVVPPATAQILEFRRDCYYEFDDMTTVKVVSCARDGNDFYFRNLFSDPVSFDNPLWVKGTLDGRILTIPGGQLVGVDDRSYFGYNTKTHLDWDIEDFVVDADPVKFIYDEATGTFSTKDDIGYTQGHEYLCDYFPAPTLTPFTPVAAEPAIPQFVMFDDEWFDYVGTATFVFLLPYYDGQGNFIDPDRMSYSVYVDSDRPYTFTPARYPELTEPVSEFHYFAQYGCAKYSPSEATQRHLVDFTHNDFKKVGVQSFYTVDGVRKASPILWYERDTDGVEDVIAGKVALAVEYFDMIGRKCSADAAGILIKRTTYSDGSVDTCRTLRR